MKDGLKFPRAPRPFDDISSERVDWSMPGLKEINTTILRAQNDAENELKILGENNIEQLILRILYSTNFGEILIGLMVKEKQIQFFTRTGSTTQS